MLYFPCISVNLTVGGLGNLAVQELDSVDDIVVSAANAADGQTVATRAETAAEGDVLYRVNIFHHYRIRSLTHLARVDSNTVVLVVNLGTVNGDTSALTDIKAIGVVSALGITLSIVNGHLVDGQTVDGVDADSLDRGVLDVQVVEDRVSQAVGGEELGLLLATVSTLAVPPAGTVSV